MKKKQITSNNNTNEAFSTNEKTFFHFILSKENRIWFILSCLVGIVYFFISNKLFPFPNLYPDSYTYIECANKNILVNFRPVEYSKFIIFFKQFSATHTALIIAQYAFFLISNLFLFLTLLYTLKMSKLAKYALFTFLFINPVYILTSNAVLSDPFFSSIAVIWVTVLIWLLLKPHLLLFVLQLIATLFLFKLRYHGIIFPVLFTITCFFIPYNNWLKTLFVAINVVALFFIVKETTDINEDQTYTRTFSAFSGWQMANNALYVLQNKEVSIDTTAFDKLDNNRFKDFAVYLKTYLDTVKNPIASKLVNGAYIWNEASPLKKYLLVYLRKHEKEFFVDANNQISYFEIWQLMGPIYSKVGQEVIMQHPAIYFKNFIKPNIAAYFNSDLEAYQEYCTNKDTIQSSVTDYYHYSNIKIEKKSKETYKTLIAPFPRLFLFSNILFYISLIVYLVVFWKKWNPVFIKILALFILLYLINLGFISLLAPTVFRYHIFIFTLLFPISLYMIDAIVLKFLSNKKAPQ